MKIWMDKNVKLEEDKETKDVKQEIIEIRNRFLQEYYSIGQSLTREKRIILELAINSLDTILILYY